MTQLSPNNRNLLINGVNLLVPAFIFILYFVFYNFGKISPSEMVKSTGLTSISVLTLTMTVGPLVYFVPGLNFLKIHRKVWGIAALLFALAHVALVFVYYFKFNWYRFIDTGNPKFTGLLFGLLPLLVMLVIVSVSNRRAMLILSPRTWAAIQSTSYLALALSLAHFFLIEQTNGVLVIKRTFGIITFSFVTAVVLVRLALFFPVFLKKFSKSPKTA